MKNFKQIAFGLIVGAMAIGFSAFTNAGSHERGKAVRPGAITANFLVQPSLNNFAQLASGTPSNGDCKSTATLNCSYDVTPDGKDNIPDQASYSATEVNTYVTNGWLTPHSGSGLRIYQP